MIQSYFDKIVSRFTDFLHKKSDSKYGKLNFANESLFAYSDELKTFLSEEYNVKWSDMNMSFQDLLSLTFKGGEFVADDSLKLASADSDELDQYEFMIGYLNEFINNPEIKALIDKNNDGLLSEQEVETYFNKIKGADGNADDLSFEDLSLTFSSVTNTPDPVSSNNIFANPNNGSGGKTINTDNGDNSGTDNGPDTGNKDYSSMNVDDLSKLQDQNQKQLTAYENDLSNAIAGKTDKIETANTTYEEARKAYEEAIENDKALGDLKQQSIDNQKSIDQTESAITQLQAEQAQNDSQMNQKQNEINGYAADLSALSATKSKLSSQKSDDPKKQKQISDNLQKVDAEITRITELESKAKKELEQLEKKQGELEQSLNDKTTELSALQEAKGNIDKAISENKEVSDTTKTALKNMNDAKAALDKAKSDAISAAKSNIDTTKTEATKINEVLNAKKAEENQKQYNVNSGEFYSDSDYTFEHVQNPNGFDYVLIKPADLDPTEEVPVMTWLHGWQDGNFDRIQKTSMYDLLKNHPEEMGGTFNGIIVMPLSPDSKWKGEVEDIKNVVREVGKSYAIDKDNIIVAGHSEGSLGVLACAGGNQDHFFSKALCCSASFVNGNIMDSINIPVYCVGGNGDMDKNTASVSGSIKKRGQDSVYMHVGVGHGDVPRYAFKQHYDEIFKLLFPSLYKQA